MSFKEYPWMERVVLCHGCFDILHVGHFEHFRQARQFADRLVVSVTSAEWVRRAKGAGHPAHTDQQRLEMLRDLRTVDEVWLCEDPTGVPAILHFRPVFYVKGADYLKKDINPAERAACEAVGARVVFTTTQKRSIKDLTQEFQ